MADTKYRLTVEELQMFANQLEMLPVKVNGHESVAELLQQVEKFQRQADLLLKETKKPDAKEIEQCLEFGLSLDVDLKDLNLLKDKHAQMQWLEEAQELLDNNESTTFDQLKRMIEKGTDLPPHTDVEMALGKISGLLSQVITNNTKILNI